MQDFLTSIQDILNDPSNLMIIGLLISFILFLTEGYKYIKYKTRSDILDLSLLAMIFLLSFIVFDDLYLSFLAVVFFLMIIGTYELRESPVWVRLMASFTITYGYLLSSVIIARSLDILIKNGMVTLPSWLQKTDQISGFALSTTLWVLLIFSFAFFGKRFILVSRFLSPQYVYLFLYGLVYLIILLIEGIPWEYRFIGLFLVNVFLYLISGYLLSFIFGIKPLTDERSLAIVREVEQKIDTKIKAVGIVQAPILNAFAYGPFFDQRFAFIVKDINNYSDKELKGIAAHEISHLKGKHTFWLLWIGAIDIFLRWLLNVPVSSYDIAAGLTNWRLFDYYLVNMLFFAVSLIFVRIMEGNADKRTKEIGLGSELSQALFRLEGYYRGIAGELGLNAQLLTDTTRTPIEETRFTGEAAIEMHNRLQNPSRYGLAMNLIVSHPPTAFRIAAIVSDDISTIRLAFMPILLLLPFFRSRNLNLLKRAESEFSENLTNSFNIIHNSVENFVNSTYLLAKTEKFLGKNVLLRPKYGKQLEFIEGKLTKIDIANNIVDPLLYTIETENGIVNVHSKQYTLSLFEKGKFYLLKSKRVALLKRLHKENKGKYRYIYQVKGKEVKLKYLGLSFTEFTSSNFVLSSRGRNKFLDPSKFLSEIDPTSDFSKGNGLKDSNFQLEMFNDETKTLKGKLLLFSPPPIVLIFLKRFKNENGQFIKDLINKQLHVTLYTSKDPDMGIPCVFQEYKSENEITFLTPGEKNPDTIALKQLDAIVLRSECLLIHLSSEIGLFSKLYNKLENYFSASLKSF